MKKINVKVTVFLSVIVLAVIILLLNFIDSARRWILRHREYGC